MSHEEHHGSAHGAHETTDVTVRPLVVYGIILSAILAGSLVLMWVLFQFYAAMPVREGGPVSPLSAERVPPPRPRLQTMETQAKDLVETRISEGEELTSYGWVDKSKGIVRIPVERAMQLALQHGLPKAAPQKAEPKKK
jgi:hypothetical protein